MDWYTYIYHLEDQEIDSLLKKPVHVGYLQQFVITSKSNIVNYININKSSQASLTTTTSIYIYETSSRLYKFCLTKFLPLTIS